MLQHKAKKSLGQNFLTALSVVSEIVETGEVSSADTVLEIGPGKGILTKSLLATGSIVIAVEKDDSLYEYLLEEFSEYIKNKKLHLIHGDILELLPEIKLATNYKLIANIPYNITGKIISDFLSLQQKPKTMVLMVQYEVASRIVAKNKKGSILSMSVSVYGTPKLVRRVSAGSFYPKPRVDSAVLAITEISDSFFVKNKITEIQFFTVLKAGFAHKRKKLSGNLQDTFPNIDFRLLFERLSLDENIRAEDLDKNGWGRLVNTLYKYI